MTVVSCVAIALALILGVLVGVVGGIIWFINELTRGL
jgi:hypothetical protein